MKTTKGIKYGKVSAWFAARFLLRYLRTRSFSAADGLRIGKAADSGSVFAKAVDRLMEILSISYMDLHAFRRELDKASADKPAVKLDDVLKQVEQSSRSRAAARRKGKVRR